MLFDSTMLLLRNIVNSLQSGDESRWDDNVESGNQCLYEIHQMGRSSSRTYKTDSNPKFRTVMPASERAVRAIPHVKSMNAAIRRKDREAAIVSGKSAIAEMTGNPVLLPLASAVPPVAETEDTEKPQASRTLVVHATKRPAAKKHLSSPKRKPAKVLTASKS